jgi:thiol-disulfide isomerase/thioredoxin
MVERLILLIVLAVVAVIVAAVLHRRRPDPPSAPSYRAPHQLDRADFADADTPVLVVVFASTTCSTCPAVWSEVEALARPGVAVQRIDVQDAADLHQRYRIDGVPTTVVVGRDGAVVTTFFGPLADGDLPAAVEAAQSADSGGDRPA